MTHFVKRQPRWRVVAAVMAVAVIGFMVFRGGGDTANSGATFAARRGPLNITVLEGGSLQALESQEIKCEVRVGYQGTKIIRIVEEGYLVTDEDVRNGKILVELDSSEIENQLVQQEIQFQSASASYTDAQQNYEIQLNQNVSDIKAAEQKARFARMDFDKYLGEEVAEALVQEHGFDKVVMISRPGMGGVARPSSSQPMSFEPAKGNAARPAEMIRMVTDAPPRLDNGDLPRIPADRAPEAGTPTEPEPIAMETTPTVVVDFSKYARLDLLGAGEAKQRLRKLEDDLLVAQKEAEQSDNTLAGTKKLHDKGFVTRNDLQRDEIAQQNSRLKVQTAITARDLFEKYEFVKAAEEALSRYSEAVRELERAKRAAVSKLAQSESRLRSTEAQYNVQLRRRDNLLEQKEKCVIQATKPGLVVYGGSRDDGSFGGEERIREGATVRERQAIITIPNLNRMAVNVKIHESYIKKVRRGLAAKVTIDAFPDQILDAEVTKVAVLPDSQNRWMNPDLKVYLTELAINGSHDWVKPGMSAKVEILVDRLEDVVQIPVQSVVPEDGRQVCYVQSGFKPEKRAIEIGQFNDEFIEVRAGLQEGEKVLLRPPSAARENIVPSGPENEPVEPATASAPAPAAA